MSGDIGSYVKQNLNKWLSGEVFWDFLSSKLYSYTYHKNLRFQEATLKRLQVFASICKYLSAA